MDVFHSPDQQGCNYSASKWVRSEGGGGLDPKLTSPPSTSNQQLEDFTQYAHHSLVPQLSASHQQQQSSQQQQPEPYQRAEQLQGYSDNLTALYDDSPPTFYNPQLPMTTNSWNDSFQASQWLVNSSRWTFSDPHPASLGWFPSSQLATPRTGGTSWDADHTSALSSRAQLKPFIEKLYSILVRPSSFRDCLVWDEAGTAFIVSHANPRLLQQVFPDAFGHSNLHSFTRQLNIYGFTRCTSAELLRKLNVT